METSFASKSKLFETTDSSNVDFLGIQLPVISAMLPSLVLNKIATTQALDRRSGGVFYLDLKYGQNKGGVTSGDKMISAKTGQNKTTDGKLYASTRVGAEVITGTTGPNTALSYLPVIAGTLVITNGTETLTDNGAGVLVSNLSGGRTGTIVYATGLWTISGALSGGGTMTASYRYNYETGGLAGAVANNVPSVDFDLTYETVTAEDFPIKALYTLASALDINKSVSRRSNTMLN